MADPQLIDYIKTYLAQGYNIEVIRNTLLQNNYSVQDVNEAVNEVLASAQTIKVEHKISISKGVILAFVLIFMAGIIFGLVKFLAPVEALLDLKLSSYPASVSPGDILEFTREVSNMGSKKRFDILIRYEVMDLKTREVISKMEETEAVETKSSSRPKIVVPKDILEGEYMLKATAYYGAREAGASFNFKVEKAEEPKKEEAITITNESVKECREKCNDYNICTKDLCVEGACTYEKIIPCCGDFRCEEGETEEKCPEDCLKALGVGEAMSEIIKQAKDISTQDISKSAMLCKTIQDTFNSDECLLEVAKLSKKSIVCEQIFEKRTKDKCYMDFAIKEEQFELCEKLYDRWLKQSCMSYAKLSQINMPAN